MVFCNRHGWLLLMLLATGTTPAFGQDLSWIQPYSGNIVYGPLSPSPGNLPNCPECQCDACQPDGAKGFFKRLFCGEKVRRCRREYYYCKQMYHTSYTPPVLPPYCEIGYGFYETSWRSPGFASVACDPTGINPGYDRHVPAIPVPAPLDDSPNQSREWNPMEDSEANPVPDAPSGDEKPRYQEPVSPPGTARWQSSSPLSEQVNRMPIITPR
jgi:hypothetical protein